MMATAHILLRVSAGDTKSVYQELSRISGVVSIDAISGPYDLIATVQGADFNAIGTLVLNEIRDVKGVTETVTCNVIGFEV
jgi:DNA-binding Lrp family transcriptional regulator